MKCRTYKRCKMGEKELMKKLGFDGNLVNIATVEWDISSKPKKVIIEYEV